MSLSQLPVTLVFGAMRDKNLEQMAESLFPVARTLVLTRPDSPRSAAVEELQRISLAYCGEPESSHRKFDARRYHESYRSDSAGWVNLFLRLSIPDW